jgi:hypothetical protein
MRWDSKRRQLLPDAVAKLPPVDRNPAQSRHRAVRVFFGFVLAAITLVLLAVLRHWSAAKHFDELPYDARQNPEPSTWVGALDGDPRQSFRLVIESVHDQQISGYMDWNLGQVRLAVSGTYEGNDLRFEDHSVVRGRVDEKWLHHVKHVRIMGTLMRGTDRNGHAQLEAHRTNGASAQAYAHGRGQDRLRDYCGTLEQMTGKPDRACLTQMGDCEKLERMLGKQDTWCLTNLAQKTGEAEPCDRILEPSPKAMCYLHAAAASRDAGLCQQLESICTSAPFQAAHECGRSRVTYRRTCQAVVAHDPKVCDGLAEGRGWDEEEFCILAVAQTGGRWSACQHIRWPAQRARCESLVGAVDPMDPYQMRPTPKNCQARPPDQRPPCLLQSAFTTWNPAACDALAPEWQAACRRLIPPHPVDSTK